MNEFTIVTGKLAQTAMTTLTSASLLEGAFSPIRVSNHILTKSTFIE
jgi:hypothetical protein